MFKPGELVHKVFLYKIRKGQECYEEIPGVFIVLKSLLGAEGREVSLYSPRLGSKIQTREHLVTKVNTSDELVGEDKEERTGIYIPLNERGDLFDKVSGKVVIAKKGA